MNEWKNLVEGQFLNIDAIKEGFRGPKHGLPQSRKETKNKLLTQYSGQDEHVPRMLIGSEDSKVSLREEGKVQIHKKVT